MTWVRPPRECGAYVAVRRAFLAADVHIGPMQRSTASNLILAVSLCAAMAGCAEWTVARGPAPVATAEAARRGSSRPIQIELHSGKVVALRDAAVSGDSVTGSVWGVGNDAAPARAAYALADIRRVEYKRIVIAPVLHYGARWIATTFAVLLLIVFVALATWDA
jgi:hypothetical protein